MRFACAQWIEDHVALSFCAESQAEHMQLEKLMADLQSLGADVVQFSGDYEKGWTARVRLTAAKQK